MFTKPIDRWYVLECQWTENKYKVILRRQWEKRTIWVIDHIKNEWTTNRREQHIVLYDDTIWFNKYLIDTLPSDMNVKIWKSKVAIQTLREKWKTSPLVDYKYDQQRFVPARLFNL
jgi:hypothetical protein